jgi:hypothetical protein
MSVVLDCMCMLHTLITPEVAVTTDCSKNQHACLSTTESSSLNNERLPTQRQAQQGGPIRFGDSRGPSCALQCAWNLGCRHCTSAMEGGFGA